MFGLAVKVLLVAVTMPGPGFGAHPMPAGPPLPVSAAIDSQCGQPAQLLDLTNWKVTLPVAKPDDAEGPLEITQPKLGGLANGPFFSSTPACDGVVFRAPVNGVTTSGSKNPRSELREMTDNGSGPAGWSSTAGTHTMAVTEAFVHLPAVKPHLVGAQIHDADDDISVFRLEGRNLYVTKGDDPHYKLVTDSYALGTRFEARYEVSDGEVRAYYNGLLQTTIEDRFRGAYFKAGAYPQANCGNSAPCSGDNYGETVIYQIMVDHQLTTWDLIWDWVVVWVPIGLAVILLLVAGYQVVRRVRTRVH